jgi:hypothetical protein
MISKEKEIRNMLEYLSGKDYNFQKRGDGEFCITHSLISDESIPKRDNDSLNIDFNKKEIEVYSYDESYHNGDHYHCVNTKLDWSKLESIRDVVKKYVRAVAEKEVLETFKNSLVEKRLEVIMKGK